MAWWNPFSDDTGKTLSPKKAAEQKDVTDRDTSRIYSMYKAKPVKQTVSKAKPVKQKKSTGGLSRAQQIQDEVDKALGKKRKGDTVKNYARGGGVRPADNEYK